MVIWNIQNDYIWYALAFCFGYFMIDVQVTEKLSRNRFGFYLHPGAHGT